MRGHVVRVVPEAEMVTAEIQQRTGKNGGKPETNLTSKRPDTVAIIDRFAGRIAMLEKTRAELLAAAAGEGGEDSGPLPWVD